MATVSRLMTEEEFLALPEDDGIERELIRGELREYPSMTTRGYAHSVVVFKIGHHLSLWLRRQPEPRGTIIGGEARVRLRRDPLTFVGIDVAYIASNT